MVEVDHVKAHRTKKEKQETPQFERFVTEGNEKADELAKAGGNVGRRLQGGSESKVNVARKRRGVCSCSQLSLFSGKWRDREELKPKPKEKVELRGSKKGGDEASNGEVR